MSVGVRRRYATRDTCHANRGLKSTATIGNRSAVNLTLKANQNRQGKRPRDCSEIYRPTECAPRRAGIAVDLDESVYALLMKEGYSPEFGARPMERAVEALIAQPLAKVMLERRLDPGAELIVRASGQRVTFERRR